MKGHVTGTVRERSHMEPVHTTIGIQRVGELTYSRADLTDADYADSFRIDLHDASLDAETWARILLEQTATGKAAPGLWRAMGLRLGPASSTLHVQGWRVEQVEPAYATLSARTWYMSGRAVVEASPTELALSLFVRYDHVAGRIIWPPIAVLHRRAVPRMLRHALVLGQRHGRR